MNIIVATNNTGGIGLDNSIPWKNINDMQFFKMMTYGKTVCMGRKTFDSLGKPLSNRINCVLSSKKIDCPGVVSYTDKDKFLTRILNDRDCFVIGGEQIYSMALEANVIDNIYLSVVDNNRSCDTHFNLPDNFKRVSAMIFDDLKIERWVK